MGESEQKGPLEKPIDWFASWKASFERVRQRYGTPVTVLLTLVVVGGLVWWHWDAIAGRCGCKGQRKLSASIRGDDHAARRLLGRPEADFRPPQPNPLGRIDGSARALHRQQA